MKANEKKQAFILLRAEGKSYRAIEKEIGVSRSTCGEWEKSLKQDVERIKRENLEALYTSYGMAREARIRRVGDTLHRIEEALERVDLSEIPPEKLLDYKLKYSAALRAEYSALAPVEATGEIADTLEAIKDLYRRTASGETTIEQAKTELSIIDHLIEGYTRANPFQTIS